MSPVSCHRSGCWIYIQQDPKIPTHIHIYVLCEIKMKDKNSKSIRFGLICWRCCEQHHNHMMSTGSYFTICIDIYILCRTGHFTVILRSPKWRGTYRPLLYWAPRGSRTGCHPYRSCAADVSIWDGREQSGRTCTCRERKTHIRCARPWTSAASPRTGQSQPKIEPWYCPTRWRGKCISIHADAVIQVTQ